MPKAIDGMKKCSKCGKIKSIDQFHKRSNRPDGHMYSCKECEIKRRKEWYEKNKDKARKNARERRKTIKGTANYMYYTYKSRNIEKDKFDITKEWLIKKLKKGKCELTGIEFDYKGKKSKLYSPSLDRINSDKGYTKQNTQMVLWMVNSWKHTGTIEEMEKVGKAFLEKRGYKVIKEDDNND